MADRTSHSSHRLPWFIAGLGSGAAIAIPLTLAFMSRSNSPTAAPPPAPPVAVVPAAAPLTWADRCKSLSFPPVEASAKDSVRTEYDEFDKFLAMRSSEIIVGNNPLDRSTLLEFQVTFPAEDLNPTVPPEFVQMSVSTEAQTPIKRLVFLADDERIEPEPVDSHRGLSWFRLSTENLLRLVNAETLRARADRREFKLTKAERQYLRDFASMLNRHR